MTTNAKQSAFGQGWRNFSVRFLAIAWVGGWALLRYAVHRLGVWDDSAALARLRGCVLRDAMTRLGATFIKLGQVMSTRPDLFAPEMIAELRKLQDDVPPFDPTTARNLVRASLGRDLDSVFVEFDHVPVAAASVSQVHRARLREGEVEVAVKILRPDVRMKVQRDAMILIQCARALERLSTAAQHADLVSHAEHFVDGIVKQTDLRLEAANYARFSQNFAQVEGVNFPRVHAQWSGASMLVVDFIRGRKVDTLRPGATTDAIATRLRRAFLQMCFEDGFLHADLHPGNLLIDDKDQIWIFDVGLAVGLTKEMLDFYIDFNRCLVLGGADDLVAHIRRYQTHVVDIIDWDALHEDAEVMFDEFANASASELELGVLVERIFAIGRKYDFHPRPEMTLMIVGTVTAEGIGKQLAPTLDSFEVVGSYLIPILLSRGMMTVEQLQALSRARESRGPARLT